MTTPEGTATNTAAVPAPDSAAAPVPPNPAASDPAAVPEERKADRGLFLRVFPSICLPMFLAAIDQTIVATALPNIAGELGEVERIGWVVVSYLVASTVAAPAYGRLGDSLGRKRMMLTALLLFVVASGLCAAAPTIPLLALARVLQGLGGGGLMTLSQALIGEAVPPRERGRYQGYLASIFMLSSTFGPVAGGWLTQHLGWRWVFLVNLPLGALALLMALRLPASSGLGGRRLGFDGLGLLLFTGFVTPLLLALEQAQRFDIATLPAISALIVLAVLSLWLLLRQERRASTPLIPVNLLRLAAIWRADAMAVFIGATLVSGVTFMPIYLQVVRGAEPGQVGLLLLPMTFCVALGSSFTGRMIARTGRTAVFPSYGLAVSALCWLFLAFLAPAVPLRWLPLVFGIMACSIGTGMPVVQLTVQHVAGLKNLGAAAASVQFSRSIGAALGTATVGAVLFASLTLINPDTARLFAAVVERGPGVMATLDHARQIAVQAEVAQAFRAAFTTVALFLLGALVLAWSLPVRRF